jgi:ankyrin repeat protein
MKKINFLVFTLLFVFLLVQKTNAAEFPWFNINGLEGWAEISDNMSTDKKINVLPKIYGPSGVGYFGGPSINTTDLIAVKPDGSIIVKYLILSDPAALPKEFKENVYNQIKGSGYPITLQNLNNYQLNFVKASNIIVSLVVNGNVVQSKNFGGGIISSRYTGEFNINYDSDYYSEIRNGQFKIEMNFAFPYTNFSGLTINLNQTAINRIKVESFRQVIQQRSTSGSSFLIWDFRRTVVRNIEKERISSNVTSQYVSNIDIVLRDPDETTLSILDNLLGVTKLSKEDFIKRHEALTLQAFAQNNPKLGDLSKRYVEAVKNNDEAKQLDVLKSLVALQSGDIATFIATGVRFSESSVSGNSTYVGVFEANITSTNIENYTSKVIKTIEYNYTTMIEDFSLMSHVILQAELSQRMNLFGSMYPTSEIVNFKLLESVNSNNLINTKLCLANGGNPNYETLDKSLLSIAIEKNNIEMVRLLLKNGANPNTKNIYGETPIILASNNNQLNIVQLLNEYKDKFGKIKLVIHNQQGVSLENFKLSIDNKAKDVSISIKQMDLLKTEEITMYPNRYNISFSIIASFLISHNQWNNNTHYRLLNNGFSFKSTPDGIIYSKNIIIYDNIKVINNVSNEFKYKIVFDSFNYNFIEESSKHINPTTYNPTIQPNSNGQGGFFNFEK